VPRRVEGGKTMLRHSHVPLVLPLHAVRAEVVARERRGGEERSTW
jgi:hypothetical protein